MPKVKPSKQLYLALAQQPSLVLAQSLECNMVLVLYATKQHHLALTQQPYLALAQSVVSNMVLVLCSAKQHHLALIQQPYLALAQSLVVIMVLVLCSTMAPKHYQCSLPWWYLALAPTNTAFKPRIT